MSKGQVLLVNFDKLAQKSLYEMLCRSGYNVEIANSSEDVTSLLSEGPAHVILTDLNGTQDIEFLKAIKDKSYNSEIIVVASQGNLEAAIKSIKVGAFDYLVRPVADEKIVSAIEQALAKVNSDNDIKHEEKQGMIKKQFHRKEGSYCGIVGNSRLAKEIYSIVEKISNSKATVLIYGESGTGKRLIAHAIHKADKKRRNKAFIELSCGALPREIIESELFGHTKGSFTGAISDRKGRFELAHGGTILLDDIDSLPLDLQVKLLRVLQQREFEKVGDHKTIKVDVRVIATTNQDIKKAVAEKKFREDLYYRLHVISINVPPLRERLDDLPLLVDHFMNIYSRENQKKMRGVSEEAFHALKNYNWPGNIRELENIIERAIILDTNNIIEKDDLPEMIVEEIAALRGDVSRSIIKKFDVNLKEAMQAPEKVHILRVLKEVGWNKKMAARKLGVNRTTLYNKLRKYNILPVNSDN